MPKLQELLKLKLESEDEMSNAVMQAQLTLGMAAMDYASAVGAHTAQVIQHTPGQTGVAEAEVTMTMCMERLRAASLAHAAAVLMAQAGSAK